MELMNWLNVADFFQIPTEKNGRKLTNQQREKKVKNWLNNGVIPRWTTSKVGKEVLFIKSELEKFILTNKVKQKG